MDDTTKQLLQAALAGAVRHGLTVAAGALVTDGLLQSADQTNFVNIAAGIVLGGIGLGWSFMQKRCQQKALDAAKKN